jgi:hypothetical protein
VASAPDDRDYLTVEESAALPSAAQITVWQANAKGQVESVPVRPGSSCAHRYRRDQVSELLGLEVAR